MVVFWWAILGGNLGEILGVNFWSIFFRLFSYFFGQFWGMVSWVIYGGRFLGPFWVAIFFGLFLWPFLEAILGTILSVGNCGIAPPVSATNWPTSCTSVISVKLVTRNGGASTWLPPCQHTSLSIDSVLLLLMCTGSKKAAGLVHRRCPGLEVDTHTVRAKYRIVICVPYYSFIE